MLNRMHGPTDRARLRGKFAGLAIVFAAGTVALASLAALTGGVTAQSTATQPASPVAQRDPGPSPTLGAKPVRVNDQTVVLFDGSDFSGWETREGDPTSWEIQSDGSIIVKGGDAITKSEAGSFQLHLEFLCPQTEGAEGQARSNSGVYIHGRYEIQVLDSFGDEPKSNGCGAIYSIASPTVNASRPAGEWQTYDIIFRAPIPGNADRAQTPARITVLHNGVVIHNNIDLPHATPGGIAGDVVERGPLMLQDHGDPIRYRNIWLRAL